MVGGIFFFFEVLLKLIDDVWRVYFDGFFFKDIFFLGFENLRVWLDLIEEGLELGVELVIMVIFLWDVLLFKFFFKEVLLWIGL